MTRSRRILYPALLLGPLLLMAQPATARTDPGHQAAGTPMVILDGVPVHAGRDIARELRFGIEVPWPL